MARKKQQIEEILTPAERAEKSAAEYTKVLVDSTQYSGNRKANEKIFSASMLGGEVLQNYFRWRYGNKEKTKFSAQTLGSIYQLGCDAIFKKKEYSKKYLSGLRLQYTLPNDWILSGEIDQLDLENKIIIDNKVVSGSAYKEIIKNNEDHEYNLQLATYRLLLEKNGYGSHWEGMLSVNNKAGAAIRNDQYEMIHLNMFNSTDIEFLITDATNTLNIYIDAFLENPETKLIPQSCDQFKYGKTKDVPNRCALYCDYNDVCPYFKPYQQNKAIVNSIDSMIEKSKSKTKQIEDIIDWASQI